MRHKLARVSLQEGQRFSASPEKDSLISKQLMHANRHSKNSFMIYFDYELSDKTRKLLYVYSMRYNCLVNISEALENLFQSSPSPSSTTCVCVNMSTKPDSYPSRRSVFYYSFQQIYANRTHTDSL